MPKFSKGKPNYTKGLASILAQKPVGLKITNSQIESGKLFKATRKLLNRFFGLDRNAAVPYIDRIETEKNWHLIRLKGDIDMSSIPGLERMVVEAKQHRGLMERNILLDFKHVKNVDSATIAALLVMLRDIQAQNHKLALVNISPRLEGMLKILECGELFSIYKSEDQAKKALTSSSN